MIKDKTGFSPDNLGGISNSAQQWRFLPALKKSWEQNQRAER